MPRRSVPSAQLALFGAAKKASPERLELNERQREAVEHVAGPMLVLAGAGTGKTTVLTQRIARLIREGHARPDEILAVTYTDNAALELLGRVERELGSGATQGITAKTFHAFCYELLCACKRQFKVLEPEDLWIYLRRRLPQLKLRYYTRAASPAQFLEALLEFFDNCHDELRTEADYEKFVEELAAGKHELPRVTRSKDADGLSRDEVLARCGEIAFAFRTVEQMLATDGLGTFGHMILRAMQLLRSDPDMLARARQRTRFILIDEFQDSNIAQIELAQLLAGAERNLFAVGDPDQAIYRFRGASSAAFNEFIARFPDSKGVVLDRNQRSTPALLSCAYAIIAPNPSVNCRLGRDLSFTRAVLVSDRERRARASGQTFPNELVDMAMVSSLEDEARDVAAAIQQRRATGPQARVAVLYRQHSHRALIVKELASRGIPFKVERINALETAEVRDLIACLRVLPAPPDGGSLLRVAALPVFNLDAVSVREGLRNAPRGASLAGILEKVAGGKAVLSTIENARAEIAAAEWSATAATEVAIKRFRLDAGATAVCAFRDFVRRWSGKPITTSGKLEEFLDYIEYFPQAGGVVEFRQPVSDDVNPVMLMSVHAAKGLEFDHVFVLRAGSGSFPTNYREKLFAVPRALRDPRSLAPDDGADLHKQEERRLFYVAITRARDRLSIYARTRGKKALPSGFVRELLESPARAAGWRSRTVQPSVELAAAAEILPATGLGGWFLLPASARLTGAALSASAIEDYEICPLKFKIRRDWAVPGEVAGALKFGTAIHLALRDFYDAVLAGRPRDLGGLLEVFENSLADQAFDDEHQLDLYRRQGIEQLARFFELWCEGAKPQVLHTEKTFDLKLDGLLVRGRIDRVDRTAGGGIAVVDYKTGAPKDDNDARNSLQLSIYAIAATALLGAPPERLIFYNLETNEEIVATRCEKDLEKTRERIRAVASEIAAGNFEPKPGFHCRSCLYRSMCPATEERLYTCAAVATAS